MIIFKWSTFISVLPAKYFELPLLLHLTLLVFHTLYVACIKNCANCHSIRWIGFYLIVWIILNINVVISTYHVGTSLMANNEFGEAGKKQRSSAIFFSKWWLCNSLIFCVNFKNCNFTSNHWWKFRKHVEIEVLNLEYFFS